MALGVTVISIVFIFGFKPTEFISDFLYDRQEKKNERKEERAVAIREQRKQEERRPVKSNKIYNVEEDIDIPRKETKKERRLREEEERRRQALEVDQLTINNLEEETESKGGLLKKFKHNKDDIVPLGMKDETSKQAPDFIEENLFKQEQETKEEKVKEVLQLEHTLTVEDEMYELKAKCDQLQKDFLRLIERDAEVFEPLSKAYGMPKETEEEKAEKARVMEIVLKDACSVPMEIMEKCCEAIELIVEFGAKGSKLAISDAGVGAAFCKAALQGASLNVYINTKSMADREYAEELNRKADAMLEKYTKIADDTFNSVLGRLK